MNADQVDAIRAALDSRLAQSHFALPGIVESYDPTTQTADVRPGVRRPVPTDEEGEFVTEALPVVPSVPVCWPRGAGQHFAPGLQAGDGVLLVVCDLDPATWYRTGDVSDPADLGKSSLAHAVCVPGFFPRSGALSPSARDLKVADAEVGGTTQEAAVANAVAVELNAIAIALDTIAAAVPTGNPYPAGANTVAAIRARVQSAVLKLGS